jgi:nickel/cobalt exporter
MKAIRRLITMLLTLTLTFAFVPAAFAHPLGNFTINHYAGIHVGSDSVTIDYVLDMAEIPAFQEISTFDINGNAQADATEAAAYHAAKCASLQPDLGLMLNQKALGLTLASSAVEFPAGAGGLPTLRLTCGFSASVMNEDSLTSLSFVDRSYSERLGWREIVVTSDDLTLTGDFASTSISERLTAYPEDLLSSPLDQREIRLAIGSSSTLPQNNSEVSTQQTSSITGNRNDAFTQLIMLENLTLPTILFAILISFVWGAMHAMTPGHGKTIVGAYLVGSRGTMKHALYLGLTTTITHTLGVFAFGLITLFAAQYIVPETLYPWMSLLSGLFVVGIGLNLFLDRMKSSGLKFPSLKANVQKQTLSPAFEHIHSSEDGQGHSHKFVLNSSHAGTQAPKHGGHLHIHEHGHPHVHRHHDHDHDGHHHAAGGHSHTPPEEITWRSLLALGISGGLLPCPSALVVLLGAIALNKIGFGLILVLAFSLGLAGALTAIGMLFIYAGKLFQRFPSSGKVVSFLPVLSALFVSVLGIGIMYKAWLELI